MTPLEFVQFKLVVLGRQSYHDEHPDVGMGPFPRTVVQESLKLWPIGISKEEYDDVVSFLTVYRLSPNWERDKILSNLDEELKHQL